jgi:hypothetical protein
MPFIAGKKSNEPVPYRPLFERVQDWIIKIDLAPELGPFRVGMFGLLTLMVILLYTGTQFLGLHDAAAMDAGQLARNLWRGHGYVTQNLRPFEFRYLNSIGRPPLDPKTNTQPELWTPPMYPLVLSAVFHVLTPDFDMSGNVRTLAADRVVMIFGWVLYLIGMVLLYVMAREMFDHRVATLSVFMYLFCNPLLEAATAGLSWGLMSVFFLLTAYGVFKAEKWQAEGRSTRWVLGALAGSALAVGLGTLTQYAFASVLVPLLIYVGVSFPRHWRAKCGLCVLVFLLVLTPWVARNWAVSQTLFGLSRFDMLEGIGVGTPGEIKAGQVQRMYVGELPQFRFRQQLRRTLINARQLYEVGLKDVGANYLIVFFLAGLMHRFRQEEVFRLRRFVFWTLLMAIVWMSIAGPPKRNFLTVFMPLIIVYGVAFFYVMFERLQFRTRLMRTGMIGFFAVFNSLPFLFMLLPPSTTIPYPPYDGGVATALGKAFDKDEVLVSDIPWAVAWYADRSAIWEPFEGKDFLQINYDVKRVSGIYLTQETLLQQDVLEMVSGYQRYWIQMFDLQHFPPANFPLQFTRPLTPDGQQVLISDRHR